MNTQLVAFLMVTALLSPPLLAAEPAKEKLYVAVEGEGSIAVFNTATRQRIKTITLAKGHAEHAMPVAPHNVQAAADGHSIWVTLNSAGHGHQSQAADHSGDEHSAAQAAVDEVVVIDPTSDSIVRRIPMQSGLHLAHVVLTPDSQWAYVTAQNTGVIYKINAKTYQVDHAIQAPAGSQPHGLRIAADGTTAYIALLNGKALGKLNLQTQQLDVLPLNGTPVQTATTADNKTVIASLYGNKQLAVYDVASQAIRYILLPNEAKGPVQLYPTPDSRHVYVADQGYYFQQSEGEKIYKVDLQQNKVVKSIKAGTAPHGVVISRDGHFAYISNLRSDDVSVIDLQTDREVARLPVGHEPNGITLCNQ